MVKRTITEWFYREWLAIASIAASCLAIHCWLRYADIHWNGDQGDWIAILFGSHATLYYYPASSWISLVALLLVIAQMIRSRKHKSLRKTIFEILTLLYSLFAIVVSQAMT